MECEPIYSKDSQYKAFLYTSCLVIENHDPPYIPNNLECEILKIKDRYYSDTICIRYNDKETLNAILACYASKAKKAMRKKGGHRGVESSSDTAPSLFHAMSSDSNTIQTKHNELECIEHYKVSQASKSPYYLKKLQKSLLQFISSYYLCGIGMCASIFSFAHVDYERNSDNSDSPHVETNLYTLSTAQDYILQECRKRDISLIFGTTGSGKTEIYFHAIKECLELGQQVLFLMPEISLTPQMKLRLDKAFPNMSDIWHSARTKRQKEQTLKKLQNGELYIIAGARSALFLPYDNLGLIIIDEEHDSSYKSNKQPKYNARDLAMYTKKLGIKVILGSATPSVKSYYLAKEANYLLHLENRFYNTTQELIFDNSYTMDISDTIIKHIIETLKNKKQVIIFVPLRANFKILLCLHCKEKIMCANCSITLSVHNKKSALVCHYCNFTTRIPTICPSCGMDLLSGINIGTEEVKNRLEQALNAQHIKADIAIFDRDYITTQKKLEKTLSAMHNGKIDILIGTQMIAKGHDYPNVELSVILGVDFMLLAQSYRAQEDTFSMIYQVAGRSARKENGRIVIQSRYEDIINRHWGDYRKVVYLELSQRLDIYPPFMRLALVSFVEKEDSLALGNTHAFMDILLDIYMHNKDFEIVGICEANVFKIKKKYCYQVLIRAKKPLILQKILLSALHSYNKDCDIDIDPII